MKQLLIATTNPAKLKEMFLALADIGVKLLSLKDFPAVNSVPETGATFEENAVLKAKGYFEQTKVPCVADDGGLEIDALGGEPGVKSRRWPSADEVSAGKPGSEKTDQELIKMTLDKLRGTPWEKRTAHLRTVGTYYDGKNIVSVPGSIDGYIVEEAADSCDLGYPFRPIFWIPRFKKLYQDLTPEEHEKVNHRRFVYGELAKKIKKFLE